jgi:hypothetical protein
VVPVISSAGVVLQYLIRRLSDQDPWDEDVDLLTVGEIIESD